MGRSGFGVWGLLVGAQDIGLWVYKVGHYLGVQDVAFRVQEGLVLGI